MMGPVKHAVAVNPHACVQLIDQPAESLNVEIRDQPPDDVATKEVSVYLEEAHQVVPEVGPECPDPFLVLGFR